MTRAAWLLSSLLLLGGCPSRSDSRFCSSTSPCKDPAFPFCDEIASECESSPIVGVVDLAMPISVDVDLAVNVDMSLPVDLTIPPDLTPMCVSSATCADPLSPVCDGTTATCRACSGAGDNAACAMHGALVCRLAGLNAGRCTACNVDADCGQQLCGSDGACHPCTASSECASGVCDLRTAPTSGQCVTASDIVYVDNDPSVKCGTATGSIATPYCQISTAMANLGTKHFIKVAGSMTDYDKVDYYVNTAAIAVSITGPGRNAVPPATIKAPNNDNTIYVVPDVDTVAVDFTFDGFVFSGSNRRTIVCSGSDAAPAKLTIRNSLIKGGTTGVDVNHASVMLTENVFQGGSGFGVTFGTKADWVFRNNLVSGYHDGGVEITNDSGTGSFLFNTLSLNGNGTVAGGVSVAKATTLSSSIIAGNTRTMGPGATQFDGGGAITLDHVATGTDAIVSTGKLSGDPVFRSITGTVDLRLKISAPADVTANRACCIDQVSTAVKNPGVDFERDARPIGPSLDVGGDEAL